MKEFIEKLIGRLEEEQKSYEAEHAWNYAKGLEYAVEIVNELAEEYKEERTLDCDKLLFAYSDLLRRFQNAESTVICEFSGNISKETEELEAECEELLSQFKEILYSANGPQKSAEEYINCSTDNQKLECRCKDCIHWSDMVAGATEHVKLCTVGGYMVGQKGYCVYGEKRLPAPYTEGE